MPVAFLPRMHCTCAGAEDEGRGLHPAGPAGRRRCCATAVASLGLLCLGYNRARGLAAVALSYTCPPGSHSRAPESSCTGWGRGANASPSGKQLQGPWGAVSRPADLLRNMQRVAMGRTASEQLPGMSLASSESREEKGGLSFCRLSVGDPPRMKGEPFCC